MSSSPSPASTPLPVCLEDIQAAAARLGPYLTPTPLLSCRTLSQLSGCQLWLKAEHLQRGGSFKLRGALNRLLCLTPAERARGVVAFSSGNHAQGVALAAQFLSMPATIVMPADAPAVKLEATRGYGAQVVTYDRQHQSREAIAQALCAEHGATLVPPFDDPLVIAGQGTIGLELAQQLPQLEVVLIPVGGGGLASGIAVALKALRPQVQLWGVEPATADDARQSLQAGQIVRIAPPQTIADGVATQAVGRYTFPILQALLTGIVTVPERDIARALSLILTRAKQVVEPTGALTTAAALYGHLPPGTLTGKQVVSLLCGGNLDLAQLPKLLDLVD